LKLNYIRMRRNNSTMRCRRCGFGLKDGWGFCPKCGARRNGDPMDALGRDLFSQMFGKMRKSFEEFDSMDRMFEKDFEALDLSPLFRRMRPERRGPSDERAESHVRPVKRGFTVKIKSGTGMEPKVSVETFGNVDREKLEKEIKDKFGVPVKAEARPAGRRKGGFRLPGLDQKGPPKVTEEPSHDAKRFGDRVVFDIRLPGVKSQAEIEIRDLESSVEVKALAGDKAYFKILTKPANYSLSGRRFENGVLHLEFS
jgi:hypothetical protein